MTEITIKGEFCSTKASLPQTLAFRASLHSKTLLKTPRKVCSMSIFIIVELKTEFYKII